MEHMDDMLTLNYKEIGNEGKEENKVKIKYKIQK